MLQECGCFSYFLSASGTVLVWETLSEGEPEHCRWVEVGRDGLRPKDQHGQLYEVSRCRRQGQIFLNKLEKGKES